MLASGGLSGGISSAIAGGKFMDGMRQGLIVAGLNHLGADIFEKGTDKQNGGKKSKVKFANPERDAKTVSEYTMKVLKEILDASGNSSALITSTARTPEDQARVMYNNSKTQGVKSQYTLYNSYGDQVIDQYPSMDNMLAKIYELGPSNVSHHCADFSLVNVVDIDPSSIANHEAFKNVIKTNTDVSHYIMPGKGEKAYHLEIRQPNK